MIHLNSVGIKLTFNPRAGWSACVEYSTWQHANAECIEGTIGTRYFGRNLEAVIDRAMAAATAIGVSFSPVEGLSPSIYVPGDGEDASVELPENWREMVAEQCERLGWMSCYTKESADRSAQR